MKNLKQYQQDVGQWAVECFGTVIANDKTERNHRFLEEALELVQSLGCTKGEALSLVDYVFGREVGEPTQELGGVMVTLTTLSNAHGFDIEECADRELERINQPTLKEKIRIKQQNKPKHSPLPQ